MTNEWKPKHKDEKSFQGNTHYCPGCGHGILHRLIGKAMDELGIREKSIFIDPVGCSVFTDKYFDCDHVQVPHGRSPAVATGIKRLNPDKIVIGYQGDGDLAAIGTAEIVHAANRGENYTVFFINNAIYGMTGGQMAPTTLENQVTATSPTGRITSEVGYPLKVCEMLNTLEAPAYIERVALYDFKHVKQAEKAVKKALKCQMDGKGFSLVEVLSNCPTNWKMDTKQSWEYVKNNMEPKFPLGVYREVKE